MSRDQLKIDICNYFLAAGVDRSKLAKCLELLKAAAFDDQFVDANMMVDRALAKAAKSVGAGAGENFYYRLTWNFAPKHYPVLVGFVKRFEAITEAEMEVEYALQAEIEAAIGDEFAYDEHSYDAVGGVDYVVIVHPEKVEVRAYVAGVGDRIPKQNRKYTGHQDDIRWEYPLSSLSEFKKRNDLIINAA